MSLSKKLLFIVGLPFLLQVVFLFSYSCMLKDADDLTKLESQQKKIYGHMNWLSNLTAVMCWSCEDYSVTGRAEALDSYKQAEQQLEGEIDLLRTLFPNTDQQVIDELRRWTLGVRNECRKLISLSSPDQDQLKLSMHRIRQSWQGFVHARKTLLDVERERLKHRGLSFELGSEIAIHRRQVLTEILTAGALCSVGIGLLVLFLISKHIVQRLFWISDNAKSFGEGKTPIYSVPGTDELASLNRTCKSRTKQNNETGAKRITIPMLRE